MGISYKGFLKLMVVPADSTACPQSVLPEVIHRRRLPTHNSLFGKFM
jgi:hypothetical protein